MKTKSRSNLINSCARPEEVTSSNAANLKDIILSVRLAGGSRVVRNSSKRLKSHVEFNRGVGGFMRKIPSIKRDTTGRSPSLVLPTRRCPCEIDLQTARVLYFRDCHCLRLVAHITGPCSWKNTNWTMPAKDSGNASWLTRATTLAGG